MSPTEQEGGARAARRPRRQEREAPRPDPHERARESLEHLQAAGRELIAAARAALDVAEELVDDKETLSSMADAVAGFGDLVREAASRVFSHHSAATGTAATESPDIERITVE